MGSLGSGPVGTLLAARALPAPEPLLVASFEDCTTDSTLAPVLSEAFSVDLP
jgi:hypothetical protein